MEYVGRGVDYNSGPYTVQFDVGETGVSFSVSVIDDVIYEPSETFSVNIDPSSLPTSVTIGDLSQSTVTILESDGKYLHSYKVLYIVYKCDMVQLFNPLSPCLLTCNCTQTLFNLF